MQDQNWFDASQPPDDNLTVIGAAETGDVDAAYHEDGEWRWASGNRAKIVLWMPFPDHPAFN